MEKAVVEHQSESFFRCMRDNIIVIQRGGFFSGFEAQVDCVRGSAFLKFCFFNIFLLA
jgi:hypothetical protein